MDFDFDLAPGRGLPASAQARLHAAGEVVWCESMGGWLVSSYEGVKAVLGDLARFTSEGTPVAEVFGTQGMLVNDTALHNTLRAVWAKAVSREAMAARFDELKSLAAAALGAVRPRIEAGETIDLVPVFRDFVMRFIAVTFDVPRDRLAIFERWSEASADTPALGLDEGSEEARRHFAAREQVFALVEELVAERQRRMAQSEQPADLVSLMAAAEGHQGITHSVVVDNLFNFILGAMDTTEKWLGNVLVRLLADGAAQSALRADPSLVERFNDEVMRCDSVVQTIQRRVRAGGAEVAGQAMQGGDHVFVLLGAANRDPRAFDDAERFDLHRKGKPHLGFGFGFHHCLGLNIAKQEARAFVSALLGDYPKLCVIDADFGTSWALWGPRALRVAGAPA